MLWLILAAWSIVAIAQAQGAWWILALVIALVVPAKLDGIIIYIWGGIVLAGLVSNGWLIFFCVLAVVELFLSDRGS